jgi:hypothetical protein
MQGCKRLALWSSRKLGYITACFTEMPTKGLQGKPGLEHLQDTLRIQEGHLEDLGTDLSLSVIGQFSSFLFLSLSTSQHSGALVQGWKD